MANPSNATSARPVMTHGPAQDEDPQKVAEAVAGVTGAAAGAGMGAIAGPVGALIGAAAGALGGWWAGHTVSDIAGGFSDEDDAHYRRIHEDSERRSGRTYAEVRDLYRFGHLAGSNPDYQGRGFDHIEPELQNAWRNEQREIYGAWDDVRDYVARGYETRPR